MDVEEAHRLLVAEYSRMAVAYDRDAAPYHRLLENRVLGLAGPRQGERVLDLGCGTGNLTLEAARLVGEGGGAVGIDLAGGMVSVARAKAERFGVRNVDFQRMDGRQLAFPDLSFNVVAGCLGVPSIGHERSFAEAVRVLRSRGRLAFCEWTGRGKHPPLRPLFDRFFPRVPPPEVEALREARRRIHESGAPEAVRDPEVLRSKLEGVGFRKVRILRETVRLRYPTPDAYLDRLLAWGDNEREWQAMGPQARETIRREFAELAAPFRTDEGWETESEAIYVRAVK